MTKRQKLEEAARGNLERHLGDCESQDELYDNAYVLAFDGAKDAGASMEEAREIAQELAMSFACP